MTDLSFIDAKNKTVEDVKGHLEGEEEGRAGSVQELLIVLKFMEGILYIFFLSEIFWLIIQPKRQLGSL